MNASLTEAQSYTREARRAEEIANRLEKQASYFAGHSAAGTLNLSQAYREWGLSEMENNRDFYGNVRFDDVAFQLSVEGQAMQAKFVEAYAEQLRAGIEDKLVLTPGQAVDRPNIGSAGEVRARSDISPSGGAPGQDSVDLEPLRDEVQRGQQSGRERIRDATSGLDVVTRNARGASAEAADVVKKW
jgi:conjugal transfer mating pair stabilization protein TraG